MLAGMIAMMAGRLKRWLFWLHAQGALCTMPAAARGQLLCCIVWSKARAPQGR